MSEPTNPQELAAYWKFRAIYYKDLSVSLKHENKVLRANSPENCRINSITHKDKTGDTAVGNVTRDLKNRK